MDFSDPKKAFEHITKPAQLKPVKENWLILYQGKPIQLDGQDDPTKEIYTMMSDRI